MPWRWRQNTAQLSKQGPNPSGSQQPAPGSGPGCATKPRDFTPVILCFLIRKVDIIIIPTKYLGFIFLIKVSSIKASIYFHLFGCSKNIYCMPTLCQASHWVWYIQLPKELRY